MRLLVVSYFLDGYNRTEIAKILKVARTSANLWVSAYLSEGISGLDSTPPPGRPPRLSTKQLNQLTQYIDEQSCSSDAGRLMGQDICDYIKNEFGVTYHRDHIYRLLKKLGYSWITSRSRHPKQSDDVQDVFKKLQTGNDPSHAL